MNNISKLKRLLDIQSYKSLNQFTKGYKGSIIFLTFLNVFTLLLGVLLAIITKRMIDLAIDRRITEAVYYGIALAVVLMLQTGQSSLTSYHTIRLVESMKNKLQLEVIKKIYRKKWLAINAYPSGDLLTRVYTDINNIVSAVTTVIPTIIAFMIQLIVAFTILAYYDTVLAMLAFLITPITIIISMLIGRQLKKVQSNIQAAEAKQRSKINESFHNLLILKTYNYLTTNENHIENLQNQRFSHIKKKNNITIKANIMLSLGYRAGFFFALALGAYRLAMKAITFGTYTAFLQLVGQVQVPIQGMSKQIPMLISSFSSIERIDEINQLESDDHSARISTDLPESIRIEHLTFSYNKDHNVIDDFSLTINKGEKIAIVGPSGQGKTTLIHLLLALIKPNSGSISFTVGNNRIIKAAANTRAYFSYVPQTNTLFSGTIRENFLLTKECSDEEIIQALKAACAYDFISNLENGLDTYIQENGLGLSQGQAQRITIARAFLHQTPILIFDEATSALDMETEKTLVENVNHYYPNTTLIAVTHRTSILSICDRVIEL